MRTAASRLMYEGKNFVYIQKAGDQDICQNCRWEANAKCGFIKRSQSGMADYVKEGFFMVVHKSGYLGDPEKKTESRNEKNARKNFSSSTQNSDQANLGLHEPWEVYDSCPTRTEFQPTTFEKKNAGFECKHERENHPVNYPTIWHDVAVFNGGDQPCKFTPQRVFECVEKYAGSNFRKHKSIYKDRRSCIAAKGQWLEFWQFIDRATDKRSKSACENTRIRGLRLKWGRPLDYKKISNDIIASEECLVLPPMPVCNTGLIGGKLVTRPNIFSMNENTSDWPTFKWRIPQLYSKSQEKSCVLRVRHFVYDSDKSSETQQVIHNYDQDVNISNGKFSIFMANPYSVNKRSKQNTGGSTRNLYPKQVFQDRSHIITIQPRHSQNVPENLNIQTIDVRGKRGNIVQTYPAVEYDFVPMITKIPNGHAVQFQWTGSNDHDNDQGPGNDGQTGDAGNGKGGTDRNNVLQIFSHRHNYPVAFEVQTLFKGAEFKWAPKEAGNGNDRASSASSFAKKPQSKKEYSAFISHASSGHFYCEKPGECAPGYNTKNNSQKSSNLGNLDDVPPSFRGMVFIPRRNKVYHFASTRNNDFSNRSQKGSLVVGNCVMDDLACMRLDD